MTRKFRIDYMFGNLRLTSEHRTHETGVEPSEKMVKNALHTVCLDRNIQDFSQAEARIYETTGEETLSKTYKLNVKPRF
jgi:hypothetical protein